MRKIILPQMVSILVFLVVMTSSFTKDCICEHCEATKVIGVDSPNGSLEDSHGDGNRTICARDRDYDDRSFPSICHMLCYNRCNRFGPQTIQKDNEDIKIWGIFRTTAILDPPSLNSKKLIVDS
ncbi:uncharacterized protein LOC117178911 isoform X3 [Belonocnema kinseyi]|uniref:uncharacterized protein LOC117178911 isoform X3 n=1 Tax=Belonocnema kinseyi TaxID=2817044 RepID=UPI00143D7559|nr:uncharacterized protein LOC117178911 isoform X3 [Belonocnema kinseyi]